MKNKLTLTIASAVALATASAFGQMTTTETTTTETTPVSETTTTETSTTFSSGKVIVDSSGAQLGTVQRVITPSTGGRLVVVKSESGSYVVPQRVMTVSGETITYTGERTLLTSAPTWSETTTYETRESVAPVYKHFNVEIDDGEVEVEAED